MAANILPNRVFGFGTNKIFDAGFDSQFQWLGDMHNVTLRGNYIFERQILDSTFAQGNSANPVDYLRNLKFSAEYVYDHTYAINVARFQLTGTPDALVYSSFQNLVPNTQGWIVDVSIFAVFAWSARPLAVLQHAHWPRLYLFLAAERLE